MFNWVAKYLEVLRRLASPQWHQELIRFGVVFGGGWLLFDALGQPHPFLCGVAILAVYIGSKG